MRRLRATLAWALPMMAGTALAQTAFCVLLASAASIARAELPPPPVSPTPVTRFEYDAQGNRTKIIRDPGGLNLETRLSYDPQYRVKELTDPKNGKTALEYDGGSQPTKVTDPRGLVTQYPRNGFGDATQLISPDTGITNVTYDSARNLKTRTDSRGVTATYSYDASNRLTGVVYSQSGQPTQSDSWVYGQTGPGFSNGIGRLTSTSHPAGSSQFAYDPWGAVVTSTQRVAAASGANAAEVVSVVGYGYTSAGRLSSITYPSGRRLERSYTSRHVTAMSLAQVANGTPVPLLTDIKWEPFGPVASWNWNMAGGTTPHERFYDLSGRVTRYRLGNVFRDVTYDTADRIISFTHLSASDGIPQPGLDQSFGYLCPCQPPIA